VTGPMVRSRTRGSVPLVDAAAILGDGRLQVFALNRSPDRAAPVQLSTPAHRLEPGQGELLTASSPEATNAWDHLDAVVPVPFEVSTETDTAAFELPPLSFLAVTFGMQ